MPDKLGYLELSDALFKKFAELLYKESGMTLKDHKKYLLIHRLSKLVGPDKKHQNFDAYYEDLVKDKTGNLVVEFVNLLTTNFSFFFREEIHFETASNYLKQHVQSGGPIRLWSAACSTGEEPYSLAITCKRALPDLHRHDLKILATDISTRVLEIAKAGSYHYTRVRGHLEDSELRTYFDFDRDNNHFIVKPEIRNMIAFRYLNLMEPYPFQKQFDIVFLRNVLIYFDNQEKETIINQIADYIKPGGLLLLGLSESLVGIRSPLVTMKNSIYQKPA